MADKPPPSWSYSSVALDAGTWHLFEGLAGRHNGVFGGCWCIYFHPDGPERGQGAEANRSLKRCYVDAGRAHAALVVDGDEAVAWCEYGTPEELPTIHHRKQYEAALDLLPDYRLTCIFVDRRYRRRGLAEVALRGALDLIAQAGGGIVEGYPHEVGEKKMSSSFLYNGTRGLYERAGFTYIRPKGLRNTVMRRRVEPAMATNATGVPTPD
jgi:GNAT superfamily N-acetyltransferase